MSRIVAGVLAAGRGERMARDLPKPLVAFRGRPLVDHALEAARGSGFVPVVLVVGHRGTEVAAVAPADVEIVVNDAWSRGIASSLGALIDAVARHEDVGAVVVGLADQPLVGSEAYRRLAAAYDDRPADLLVSTYGRQRANPVLIGRPLWDEARALRGDDGARQLMGRHPVVEVPCDGTGQPTDIDTAADLAALEA